MDKHTGESRRYSNYVLAILTLGMTLSYADRHLMSVLMSPIKAELHLSDTQLGFLSGLAFAMFYAVCALPLARLTDRGSRRNMMAVVLTLWSIVTALGGFAQNFVQLLLVRMGVGVGEAGYTPAAFSLLADYFPPERRQFASGLMNAGPQIGIMASLLIGGLVAPAYGWRMAFMVAGLPGLIVAMLILFTVREPKRRFAAEAAGGGLQPSMATSLLALWKTRSYRYVTMTSAFHALSSFSLSVWMPSFLERSHGMNLGAIGPALAAATICGAFGPIVGGFFGDRTARRDARFPLFTIAFAFLLCIPTMMTVLWIGSASSAIMVFALFSFILTLSHGTMFALCISTAPERFRALGISVLMFVVAFIGFGLGPLATGFISDRLAAVGVADPLRVAMTFTTLSLLIPTVFVLLASRYLRADLEKIANGAAAANAA